MNSARFHKIPKRRKLDRKKIIALIKKHGNADQLDLTYTDISGAHLGSSMEPMYPLDGAVFGKYGDIRSGVIAENTLFQRTSLRGAKFTYAVLKTSNFYKSDMTGADLRFADLTDANLVETCLTGASLYRARFIGTKLEGANLRGADLYLATFSGQTYLSKENLGEHIIQENVQEYREFIKRAVLPTSLLTVETHLGDRYFKAAQIYQELRSHFQSIGKSADAVWAYCKERRMKKNWRGHQSDRAWKSGQKGKSLELRMSWLGDWIVELLCDYGESVWRVMGWLLALILVIGPVAIDIFGGLVWSKPSQATYFSLENEWLRFGYSYFQHLLYMLDTVTTANFSELKPANDLVRLFSGIMASMGIFLTGLLGFVAGNRIRN